MLLNLPLTIYYFMKFSRTFRSKYVYKQYADISRTYQNSRSKLKTCKQLDLFLITYLHRWCNIINNKTYSHGQNKIYHIYYYVHNSCDICYDFHIKTMYGSSSPPVVCRRVHAICMSFVFAWYSGVQHVLTIWVTGGCLIRGRYCLPFANIGVRPRFFVEVRVAHHFSFLCCPIMHLYVLSSVLWCPLRSPHKNDDRFIFTFSCL